ncbi:MAG: PD-(D/E)XK nuclease family protein, partial [Actinomycetia bacterium]|nr:PD-(D/E)XK nuclease family protein [Actinomycetes bacterium]
CFKNLERGLEARRAREGDAFTAYDGYVPRAGEDEDPTGEGGSVLSARRLETLGRCPMEYFFRYILKIEPPEEYKATPGAWLEPNEKGSLLHAVFREFMSRVSGRGVLPEYDRDIGLLEEVLEGRIASLKAEKPPPGAEEFEHERRELLETARIFLREEEEYCRTARPAYFEAAIGVPPEEAGTALDTPDPVKIELPGGKRVRARGKIDRVDEVAGSGGTMFQVWDYKTGSSYAYDRADPFKGGRRVQNALYLALVESRLGEVHPGAEAVAFGYFFPGVREQGERIRWTRAELDGYGRLIERLCRMAAGGCFPFSNDKEDADHSDYRSAFCDAAAAATAVDRKLRNEGNTAMAAFRELRGIEVGNGTG